MAVVVVVAVHKVAEKLLGMEEVDKMEWKKDLLDKVEGCEREHNSQVERKMMNLELTLVRVEVVVVVVAVMVVAAKGESADFVRPRGANRETDPHCCS